MGGIFEFFCRSIELPFRAIKYTNPFAYRNQINLKPSPQRDRKNEK